jgi:hypothetical protein
MSPSTNDLPWLTAVQGDARHEFQYRAYRTPPTSENVTTVVLETRAIGQVNNRVSFQRTAQHSAGNPGNPEMTITETLAVQGGGPVASLAIPCSEVTDVQYTVTSDWGMYFHVKDVQKIS